VVANLGTSPQTVALPSGAWRLAFSTSTVDGPLPGESAAVFTRE
jgi:hypothetical protein